MTALDIALFAYNSDNYGVLVHDPESGDTAAIDAGDSDAYLAELEKRGWTLTDIFITHHHWDHTDGLAALKDATDATVTGPKKQSKPIEGLDRLVSEGDAISFGGRVVNIIETPGHTTDMVNYHFSTDKLVFTGDTLFTLGCGRLFEGTPDMMWVSLSKLAALPEDTFVYSAHEYTLANAKFALSVDPDNLALQARAQTFAEMRERGEPTVPTTIGEELATNPFLRAANPGIRHHLGMDDASDAAVFAEIRKRKDNF